MDALLLSNNLTPIYTSMFKQPSLIGFGFVLIIMHKLLYFEEKKKLLSVDTTVLEIDFKSFLQSKKY